MTAGELEELVQRAVARALDAQLQPRIVELEQKAMRVEMAFARVEDRLSRIDARLSRLDPGNGVPSEVDLVLAEYRRRLTQGVRMAVAAVRDGVPLPALPTDEELCDEGVLVEAEPSNEHPKEEERPVVADPWGYTSRHLCGD